VALVSKSWNEAERAAPPQPTELAFDHYSLSALKWQIRDTTKLQAVTVHQARLPLASDVLRQGALKAYAAKDEVDRVCTNVLLYSLAVEAPALRLLSMAPPMPAPGFGFLQLVWRLTQLEGLTLHNWEYSDDEIPCFEYLSSLQKLKVPHSLPSSRMG